MVGAAGFEPATFRPPDGCAAGLRHAPCCYVLRKNGPERPEPLLSARFHPVLCDRCDENPSGSSFIVQPRRGFRIIGKRLPVRGCMARNVKERGPFGAMAQRSFSSCFERACRRAGCLVSDEHSLPKGRNSSFRRGSLRFFQRGAGVRRSPRRNCRWRNICRVGNHSATPWPKWSGPKRVRSRSRTSSLSASCAVL